MVELRDLFDEDFEVQTMQVSSTAVLQARKSSTLRDITGLSAALTIKVTPESGGTRVEIGMQKWFDKAAVAAVALALSAGLLIALPALALTGNTNSHRMRGRRSKRTSHAKPGGYVPPLPDAAAHAARRPAAGAAYCSGLWCKPSHGTLMSALQRDAERCDGEIL
jgi:hypothetical protein